MLIIDNQNTEATRVISLVGCGQPGLTLRVDARTSDVVRINNPGCAPVEMHAFEADCLLGALARGRLIPGVKEVLMEPESPCAHAYLSHDGKLVLSHTGSGATAIVSPEALRHLPAALRRALKPFYASLAAAA